MRWMMRLVVSAVYAGPAVAYPSFKTARASRRWHGRHFQRGSHKIYNYKTRGNNTKMSGWGRPLLEVENTPLKHLQPGAHHSTHLRPYVNASPPPDAGNHSAEGAVSHFRGRRVARD